jgi:uncharacterized membrane protein
MVTSRVFSGHWIRHTCVCSVAVWQCSSTHFEEGSLWKVGQNYLVIPIHPMLVVFPLGLFITSLVFDFIGLGMGDGIWRIVAFYLIGAGVIGGLLAAIFGLVDWIAIPNGTRAKYLGSWHGLGNAIVVVLFIISWILRRGVQATPPASAFVLSIVGVLIGAVTGWLGGELVDRLGIASMKAQIQMLPVP